MQLIGIYLVFASLIIPALATRKVTGVQRLLMGYGMEASAYAIALLISSNWELPTGAVIVWSLAALGLLLQPGLNIVCRVCNLKVEHRVK